MVTNKKKLKTADGEPCCECSCPCEGVIDIIGKKWSLCVLAQLGNNGTMRFNQIQHSLQGISAKTLADVLKDLGRSGLVKREVFAEVPPRVEYRLSPEGRELTILVAPLMDWAGRTGLIQLEN